MAIEHQITNGCSTGYSPFVLRNSLYKRFIFIIDHILVVVKRYANPKPSLTTTPLMGFSNSYAYEQNASPDRWLPIYRKTIFLAYDDTYDRTDLTSY